VKTKPKSERFVSSFGTWLVDRINIFFRLRHYIKMVAQRWVLLAISVILGLGVSVYMALKQPNIYLATATIAVAPKITSNAGGPRAQFQEEMNFYFERQQALLLSPRVQERAYIKMQDVQKAPGQTLLVESKVLKISGSLVLAMESTDLNYAKRFVTAWAQEFLIYRDEIKETVSGQKAAVVRMELTSNNRLLDRARINLTEFEKTNNIASIKDVIESTQRLYDRTEEDLKNTTAQRIKLEKTSVEEVANQGLPDLRPRAREKQPDQSKADVSERNRRDDPAFENSQTYTEFVRAKMSRVAQTNVFAASLKAKHPHIVKLEREIRNLEQDIAIQLELTAIKQNETIKALKLEEEALADMVSVYRLEVQNASQRRFGHDKLREEVDNLTLMVQNLKRELASLELLNSDEATLSLQSEGAGSPFPIRPKRVQMVIVGLLIGLGVGLGIIFLLTRLDDRLELAEDIEAELEQPVLGQIPQLDMSKLQMENVLITKLDEHNMFSEAIRGVRSAVMLGSNGSKKQVLLVSSAVPGDGKTTFTVNFAVTLAIAGYRVLLIDADLRRGNIHGYFNHSRDPGFTEMLLGELHWTDVQKSTEIKTLDVIYTGKLPSNPGELLISPVTRQFLDEARQSYDYIIFDCPPLTAIDDTFSLVGLADGLLFVVRSGQTSMRFAKNAINSVKQRGANLLGLVLNGITADNPNYYYQNYYHNYYSVAQNSGSMKDSPLPAVKMAAPKNSRPQFTSIDAQAKALSGQVVSSDALAAAERLKAERFRARTAAAKERNAKEP